ncbi:MAG: hypothetical protein LUG91_09215 [Ruminococcus sp.]|nr:hypothetical protein [Ruminococcus sp.]
MEAKPYTSSEKKQYAEFVSLTEEEYNKLVDQHGEEATLECVEILDNYKGASGKKYKSDYRAILTWVLDKYRKQHRAKLMEARASPAKNDVQATLAEMRRRIEARYQNDGQAEADPF